MAPLDSAPYVSDVRAFALTEEFTWDEWTALRHAYLRMRHAWRFHEEDWATMSGFGAFAAACLINAVRKAATSAVAVEVESDYPHEEVHTLMGPTLDRMLLGCTRSGPRQAVVFWKSGLLPLLILRRLEVEILDRMNLTVPVNRPPLEENAEVRFAVESWVPVDSRAVVMEGRLEDVAYQAIAHDDDAVASVESADGSQIYFAASAGQVIGQSLLASVDVGETVRLRTWRRFNIRSYGPGVSSAEMANCSWAEYSIEDLPEGDVMTRTELLVGDAPETAADWRVWTWGDLVSVAGWALPEEEWADDETEPAQRPMRRKVQDPPLYILRPEPEAWVEDRTFGSGGHVLLGEQTEWTFNRPVLYRIVAGEHPGMSFPRAPRRGDTFRQESAAYWSAALELLVYNLGWSSPSLGLSWWLRSGRPRSDRLLAVLDDIWFADGELDALHAWLDRGWQGFGPWTPAVEVRVIEVERDGRAGEKASSHASNGAFLNDNDAFHLNDHSRGPLAGGSRSATTLMLEQSGDVTVLVRSGLGGWHAAVAHCDPASVVHLFVPWIGRIGVFRKSPCTGIWHATSEEIHLAGNSLR